MATPVEELQPPAQLQPVAPAVAVPQTQQTVAPLSPSVQAIAPIPESPMLSTVTPGAVYAAPNIQRIDIPSTKKAMDMKLSDLEKRLAKANSIAELNQISIINQPKAMGVLTGEAAYRDRLDTARVNAFNALYQNKLIKEQRKEEARQKFISTYGADPNQRPKGMSKREFAAALTGGKFTNLLTDEARLKRADIQRTLAASAGGGTVTERIGQVNANAYKNLMASRGQDLKVDPGTYEREKINFINAGGTAQQFDTSYGSMLSNQEQERLGISTAATRALNKQQNLTAEAKKNQLNAENALLATQNLEKVLYTPEGDINKSALAWGVTGTGKLNNARSEIIDVISRLRTGAALTAEEESFYRKMLPNVWDMGSPEVVKQKMNQIKALLSGFAGGYITVQGADGRVWQFENMSDQQQRRDVRELIGEGGSIVEY